MNEFLEWVKDGSSQIFWNVVGGAAAAGLLEIILWSRRKFRHRKFKQIFGEDVGTTDYFVVYGLLRLKDLSPPDTYPYRKGGQRLSVSNPISVCEVRSAKYVSESIAAHQFLPPMLAADTELSAKLDISFVALGGPFSNFKTLDALKSDGALLRPTDGGFVFDTTGRALFTTEPGFDYGVIMKIHPPEFPNRSWIICSGLGEWGTSGAAWYLAKKWRELHKLLGDDEFAVAVRVRLGQDESATMLGAPIRRSDKSTFKQYV